MPNVKYDRSDCERLAVSKIFPDIRVNFTVDLIRVLPLNPSVREKTNVMSRRRRRLPERYNHTARRIIRGKAGAASARWTLARININFMVSTDTLPRARLKFACCLQTPEIAASSIYRWRFYPRVNHV